LNYGYAILESEIRKVINSVGLDYSIGFLHEINRSRTPLVYDIQELFRWIIDIYVIQQLEEKKIKKSDFIITENYHTRLGKNVAKMLIEKINSNFNAKYNYCFLIIKKPKISEIHT
jgi:CRISPR-associated protein Cas1